MRRKSSQGAPPPSLLRLRLRSELDPRETYGFPAKAVPLPYAPDGATVN